MYNIGGRGELQFSLHIFWKAMGIEYIKLGFDSTGRDAWNILHLVFTPLVEGKTQGWGLDLKAFFREIDDIPI